MNLQPEAEFYHAAVWKQRFLGPCPAAKVRWAKMHQLDLILTLTVGLISASALGFLALRLGWPPIAGYLLAGVLVGPHTPGFIANRALAEQAAEVGIILLMFGVGLHFRLRDLTAVRQIAVVGAVTQSAVATALGAVVAHAFGWSWKEGILFGLALSVASTVVLVRVLSDHRQLQSPAGRIAVGWLVMEDIFTVFILVLLPALGSATGPSAGQIGLAIARAALKLAAVAVVVLLLGRRLLPWLLSQVAQANSRELFTLSVLAVALGVAAGASVVFGVSMALGAFLAGMAVGQSEFSARAGAEALPMRDAFAVMFFLSVGMLFDPREFLRAPLFTLATLAVVMIGKPLAAYLISVLLGWGASVGILVGVALAQIGEFSFLLAVVARDVGALPASTLHPLVATAIVSIVLNPLLYRWVTSGALWRRWPRLEKWLSTAPLVSDATKSADVRYRAIVVGYGYIGRNIARLLSERGIEPTIIEMNLETFRQLRQQGIRAVYGDANHRAVLETAGIAEASSFILSASGSSEAVEAIRLARQLNPAIAILARADYVRQSAVLRQAGADEVFAGEAELALAMTSSLLQRLGATPEQLDQERERIRRELFEAGAAPPLEASARQAPGV